ncbi:MAG: hypothetical protein HY748_16360 [Elusimicrobia bacterium]|nr:hypothetical protein [Elusimicrobiota bacterium]
MPSLPPGLQARRSLSAAGLIFAVSLLFPPSLAQAGLDAVVLLLVALGDQKGLRSAAKLRYWLAPILFFLLIPFFIGKRDAATFLGPYSTGEAGRGLVFLLHAFAFVGLAVMFGRLASSNAIVEALERRGMRALGLRVALSLAAAKTLRSMLEETWSVFHRARPGAWETVRDADVFAAAVLRNCVRTAEDMSVLLFIRNVRV